MYRVIYSYILINYKKKCTKIQINFKKLKKNNRKRDKNVNHFGAKQIQI